MVNTNNHSIKNIKKLIVEKPKHKCLEEKIGINKFGDVHRKVSTYVVKNGKFILGD